MGLPIACSDRGPMPEVLKDGGLYFDPTNSNSIATAIEKIILDDDSRAKISYRAKVLSREFSWETCADETFAFVKETYFKHNEQS